MLQSACRMSLEGIVSKRLDAPYRSGRGDDLDQGQVPRRPRGGDRRLDDETTAASARCSSASIAAASWSMSAASAPASAATTSSASCRALKAVEADRSPFGGRQRAASAAERALGEAGAGRRDRIRRLDRRRQWCARPPSRACARTSPPTRSRPRSPRPRARRPLEREPKATSKSAKTGGQRRDGRDDLPSGQGAVARRRRRQAGHQARPRALSRSGRRLDAAAHQGPALLDRPRARRHRRRAASSSATP